MFNQQQGVGAQEDTQPIGQCGNRLKVGEGTNKNKLRAYQEKREDSFFF